VAKNGRRVMAIALLYYHFCPFFKNEKCMAKNGRKAKAVPYYPFFKNEISG
jgi:hypothetical protein